MTTHSEQLNELATALAEAQKQFPDLQRDKTVEVRTKTGGKYNFSYAPFQAVIAAVRKPLADHGLSFVQTVGHFSENGTPTLSTMLLHKSGQWIKDTAPLLAYGQGNQEYGSAITYQKRYALTALLGIASDDDDDGNGADGHEVHSTTKRTDRELLPPTNNRDLPDVPPISAEMKSKYGDSAKPSKCAYCSRYHIVMGDPLVAIKDGDSTKWGHSDCYNAKYLGKFREEPA